MLKTENLYYFLQVVKYGSINNAAAMSNITPPAISLSIKNLEQDLNLTLLNRSSKGTQVTPEGKIIARKAEKIISLLNELEQTAYELNEKSQIIKPTLKELFFFSESAFFETMLDDIAKEVYDTFPDIDFIIAQKPLRRALADLTSSSAAVALLFLGSDTIDYIEKNHADQLEIQIIKSMPLCILANKNTKWLSPHISSISLNEVTKLPLIKPDWQSCTQHTFENLLNTVENYTPHYVSIAPTMSVFNILLNNDVGVALGINHIANYDRFSTQYFSIPVNTDISVSICFIYNKALDKHTAKILADIIQHCYTLKFE